MNILTVKESNEESHSGDLRFLLRVRRPPRAPALFYRCGERSERAYHWCVSFAGKRLVSGASPTPCRDAAAGSL